VPEIVISGAGGFIGGYLSSALTAAGLSTGSYADFRDAGGSATTFVHCANIHDSPRDNAIFAADVLATVGPRVKRFVQLQTFASLHGRGRLDPDRFNLGLAPRLLSPYAHGKMLQERAVSEAARRYPGLAVRLVYLPAVLGGGSWGRVREQAKQAGVQLPPRMHAQARANHIDVSDLASHLIEANGDTRPGVRRSILNRAQSRTLTWEAFFAGAEVTHEASPRSLARLAATIGGLAGYALMTRLRPEALAAGEIDRRPPRRREPAPDPAPPHGPARFTGLIQQIVRTQPYLPA
jgi:nucleoside-diphosphate-sugar epimerase